VYDFSSVTSKIGLPLFHIGVEVCEREVAFGQKGIHFCFPGQYDPPKHKRVVLLGCTTLSAMQVGCLVKDLQLNWEAKGYSLIGNNCQTFAVDFCQRLGLASNVIPKQYRFFSGYDWVLCCKPMMATCIAAEEL